MAETASSSAVWLLVHTRGVVVHRDESGVRPLTIDELARVGARVPVDESYDVGTVGGAPVLAASFDGTAEAPFELIGPRALAMSAGAELVGAVGRALHVVDWATTSRFCGRCGTRTERMDGERCMKCPGCGLTHYPRIAPAIIVLVRRGDEALLASNAKFPAAFYSALAGFSDIGESLEQTLEREVFEEAGVRVKDIRYFGSQPWPFPHALMIGFNAEWASGEIVVDGTEISDARWFTVDALPTVPPPFSIARKLIDAWVDDVKRSRG